MCARTRGKKVTMLCKNCGNSLIPGAAFCGVCGTKADVSEFVADATAAVAEAPQQVAAAVEQPVAQAAAYVEQPVQQAAAYVEAAPQQVAAAVEQPVQQAQQQFDPDATVMMYQRAVQQPVEQPVQQPVYQQPVPPVQQPVQQPVYQQPAQQPVYQQPAQQPVYQQPVQQPVYQQPVPQAQPAQPEAPAKKKKSKGAVIVISLLLILVILAGSWVAYLTFFDKHGVKNYAGIDWNFADFTQLDKEQNEKFLELVDRVNTGILNNSARQLRKGINPGAVDYVSNSFGCKDADDFLTFCLDDLADCGDNLSASAKAYLRYEIKDCDSLASKLKEKCNAEFDVSEAYLVECVSTYRGSKSSKAVKDTYVFMKDGDGEWSLVLLGKNGIKELGID